MKARDPEEIMDELEDYLGEYLILSRDSGAIKKSDTDLSAEKLVESFYGSIIIAKNEWDDFESDISTYTELAKRLDLTEDSVTKAHQRLRDKGVLQKTDGNDLGHKITDGGLQKLLEDIKHE